MQPGSLLWGLSGFAPATDLAALDLGQAAREQEYASLGLLNSETPAFWTPAVEPAEETARATAIEPSQVVVAPRAAVPFQPASSEPRSRTPASMSASASAESSALLLTAGVTATPGIIRESAVVHSGAQGVPTMLALHEFASQIAAASPMHAESAGVALRRVDLPATTIRVEEGGTIQTSDVYVTYFGQDGADAGTAIAVDAGNNTYSTGYFGFGEDRNILVTKVDAQGQLAWATFLGGSSNDEGKGIAVDGDGNVYVVGFYTEEVLGDKDALIVRLLPDGSLDYALAVEGAGNDSFNGIALNGDSYFVTGELESATTRLLAGRLALDGTVGYLVSYSFGNNSAAGNGIAADSLGNVYLAGTMTETSLETQVIMMSLDDAGMARYAFRLVNDGPDAGLGIAYYATDAEAQIIVTGSLANKEGTTDGLLWRSRADDGELVDLSVLVSSAGGVVTPGVVIHADGSTILTGWINVEGAGLLAIIVQAEVKGGLDYFLMDGSGDDAGLGICLGNGDNVYVVGLTTSEDFPVTMTAFQPDYGGGESDAWGGLFDLA